MNTRDILKNMTFTREIVSLLNSAPPTYQLDKEAAARVLASNSRGL